MIYVGYVLLFLTPLIVGVISYNMGYSRGYAAAADPQPEVPKVWVNVHGFPFYVPVTSEFVELHYGRREAERMRSELGV